MQVIVNSCSIDNNHGMAEGLAAYIKERRERLGLKPGELARAIDKDASYISVLEGGKIKMPFPDVRRRLAVALGVSHLDILIAAGEITPDEVEAAGVTGVKPDQAPGSEAMHQMIDQIDWAAVEPGVVTLVKAVLQAAGSQGMATNVRVVDRTDQAREST